MELNKNIKMIHLGNGTDLSISNDIISGIEENIKLLVEEIK